MNNRKKWVNVVAVNGKVVTKKTIGDMSMGEFGYTVPWAFDKTSLHIDINYEVLSAKMGTATMKVQCVGTDDCGAKLYSVEHQDIFRGD